MKYQQFEDLPVWILSKELSVEIYKHFFKLNDFGFRNQIQRATVSIMNNIAEGYERKGNKELSRFLSIAKGSAGEVRSMLYLGQEIGYVSDEKFKQLKVKTETLTKQLTGFIKALNEKR